MMRSRPSWHIIIVVAIAFGGAVANADDMQGAPPFDVDQSLKGPDHKDFPWRAWAVKPYLTVQQRYLVAVRATINCGRLKDRGVQRDMHFVIKVGSADSHWVRELSYTRVHVPPGLDKAFQLQYVGGVYLRPGRYVVALLVYDDLLRKQNVWRTPVTVARLKNDPLPRLDRNLPDVEFISEAPASYFGKGYFVYDSGWAMSQGREWLPVKNRRCLCVDIVANTSVDTDNIPGFRGGAPSSHILRVASVLSHLGLLNGRIRVSIIDALRMKTLVDRRDAAGFDWQGAHRLIARQNAGTIDAGLLAQETQNFNYLLDTLREIVEDNNCAPDAKSALKIVILISGSMQLPERANVRQAIRPTLWSSRSPARFYCFISGDPGYDDLSRMLKQMKPQPEMLFSWDSLAFRKALAYLISVFEKLD
jgi:hypothetical protein